jgi:hypothetical protein
LNPSRPLQDLPIFYEKIGFKNIKKSLINTMLEKKNSNGKALEVNVVISQKSLSCTILTRRITRNGVNENPEN